MSVFVDDAQHQFGRMIMCHMWADTLDELLAMADTIGVQRKWLQQPPKASWVHFDIALSKKALAIKSGAILTDKYGPVEHVARLRSEMSNPEIRAIGIKKLAQVAQCRKMFSSAPDGSRQ
jgi:Protein of unknown function (DUF4031)